MYRGFSLKLPNNYRSGQVTTEHRLPASNSHARWPVEVSFYSAVLHVPAKHQHKFPPVLELKLHNMTTGSMAAHRGSGHHFTFMFHAQSSPTEAVYSCVPVPIVFSDYQSNVIASVDMGEHDTAEKLHFYGSIRNCDNGCTY
ncbi:unknown [Singapore grouper iridovirus]|uniref:Uncharacterized protein n=1 Tax=Singapore grouper iridovirus TaxID=262968 RepID=Q5YFQ1_9VIRU|nr:hypothetical protein ORF014L [Singapore grouper iridovirus]AAS18029.1 unknown [Singapore grouper iridovirus]WAU86723.1 hypothetical protein ORF014L [Singapore grouper iridovirus]8HIF_y3 Chain y3, Penton protein (VP14) [Singapore grouper iridovirus]